MIAENQYKRKLRLPKWLPSQSEGEKRLIFFAVKKQNNSYSSQSLLEPPPVIVDTVYELGFKIVSSIFNEIRHPLKLKLKVASIQ